MVDVETPAKAPEKDPAKKAAALWATVVAVPVTLIVGVVAFLTIMPDDPDKTEKAANPIPSTAVVMDAPQLDEKTAQACLAVTSQLPAKIRDLQGRPVSAGPEQNAAYGEPAITVACGVPQPIMCTTPEDTTPGCVAMDTELLIMNNVCWYAAPGADTATVTTMDREVPVRVTVPSYYENPAQWANEFSDTLVKTVKSKAAGTMPSGCE
ncbi:hypothetical protein Aph02nite_92580 [Actinoplanes philippinensis]|uniref:DUF3515 domain-containing protein n=1 Tax=Actinoplanes philippinensis TaxID=35752 RepID=A0A1I2MTZ1_9ACTN|nr:DUF3515 domain-containing protein [Actinoplanes philippinensis]GIE83308.1 hypothetical protein Aph02nite_92580 [Actinoplanes philippinensis]SFF95045.1 Protein of unknown function [Actinoplanes philippinensis]